MTFNQSDFHTIYFEAEIRNEELIEKIREEKGVSNPEDIFSFYELEKWATDHGFVKEPVKF